MDRKKIVEGMAEEAEKAATRQRMEDLYQITRKLCGKKKKYEHANKRQEKLRDGMNILKKY